MTRFIYDQFSKDYLEELLTPCGEVSSSKRVASEVIDELESLPEDSPYRSPTLKLLLNLRKHLEVRQELDVGERELIMRLAPLLFGCSGSSFRNCSAAFQYFVYSKC